VRDARAKEVLEDNDISHFHVLWAKKALMADE
jgi:hypothetical protein